MQRLLYVASLFLSRRDEARIPLIGRVIARFPASFFGRMPMRLRAIQQLALRYWLCSREETYGSPVRAVDPQSVRSARQSRARACPTSADAPRPQSFCSSCPPVPPCWELQQQRVRVLGLRPYWAVPWVQQAQRLWPASIRSSGEAFPALLLRPAEQCERAESAAEWVLPPSGSWRSLSLRDSG